MRISDWSSDVCSSDLPYKGGGAALADLLSNRVQVMFCNLPVCLPHIKAGKLTALGVSSARRSELLPQVPTIAESGLQRSEESRVGQACVRTCRFRGSPYHYKKKYVEISNTT